jgi:hypothetical protein
MVGFALLGFGLLGGLILLGQWYIRAEPRQIIRVARWALFALLLAIIFGLAVSGRLGWAMGAATVLIPWLIPLIRAARTAKNFARMSGIPGGSTSTVNTAFLAMSLDTESGALDGEILRGPNSGRMLSELKLEELITLLEDFAHQDAQSAQVLQAYLDREHPEWRETAGAAFDANEGSTARDAPPNGSARMTRNEALQILGLNPGVSESEIKAAHHRLIAHLHPDSGGSSFLAAQVNRAKDVLLRGE